MHKEFCFNENSFSSKEDFISYCKNYAADFYDFAIDWFSDFDYMFVQTSGSTGKPKTIKLQKKAMKNSAQATAQFFNLPVKTTALLCLPLQYIAGKMMLTRALTLGWCLDAIYPSKNPIKNIQKSYDFCAMTPMQTQYSLENLDKIKKLIIGGSPIPISLEKKLQNVKTQCFATYGMTETITHIAIKKLNNFTFQKKQNKFLNKPDKRYYKILPEIKISTDNRNCLIIDAPRVSKQKIITNDVVKIISKNEFEWLGRVDNVINSGGVKLHPEIIEKKLLACLDNRFFVAGIPDVTLGEQLILVVEGAKDEQLQHKIKNLKTLTEFEKPKQIYFVDAFVETKTKKIQRSKTLHLIPF